MRRRSTNWSVAIVAVAFLGVLSAIPARAQEGPFSPWVGERGITESVQEIMDRQAQMPSDAGVAHGLVHHHSRPQRGLPQNPSSPLVAQWPASAASSTGGGAVAAHAEEAPVAAPLTVSTSFLVVQQSDSIYTPPDTNGAVGPTQILSAVNGRVKVFDKTGLPGPLNVTGDAFFQSVRNNSPAVDPNTRYDRTSGRWFVTAINETTPNRIMIAVSSGSTITSQSSFTFYFFQQDQVAPVGNLNQFADYDKPGVDANALYIGGDMFVGNTYMASSCWVVNKASILSGGPLQAVAFRNIVSTPIAAGPVSPMGVDNDDPAASEGYVVGVDNAMFGRLVIRRISNPGGAPSISSNIFVTTPTTDQPIGQVAQGSSTPLDTVDYRLFYVNLHRDRSTGARTLWASHNIEVNSSGVAQSGGGRNGSRWYQLGNLSTTPVLLQSGTWFDNAGSSPRGFTIPSCVMTGQGHTYFGATYASSADHAGCAVTGRFAGDSLGTIQAPVLAVVSATNYNNPNGQRWGDFSKIDVDPTDDQSAWAFVEYCNALNSWGVRAIKLLAPPPATPASANPPSIAVGASNVSLIVTGTSSSGSGFYDTEPGYNRLAVTIDGTGVTVNTSTWDSPTQITLDVSVAGNAPPGPRTITVTNPDGQSVTSASGVVTIGGNALGTAFCFGDGSLPTSCPCFNFGTSGNGCASSVNANGATLAASGTTSPDTAVLSSSGEIASALTIFLQGDVNAASGIAFGDGVRCAAGTLLRLYTKTASGGASSAPQGAEPSISARSAALGDTIVPGSSRYYHAYYRDPNLVFCPFGFNATNAIRINW